MLQPAVVQQYILHNLIWIFYIFRRIIYMTDSKRNDRRTEEHTHSSQIQESTYINCELLTRKRRSFH